MVVLITILTAVPALAWEPTKPIEFIVPAGTGGGADQMARLIAGISDKHRLSPRPLIVVIFLSIVLPLDVFSGLRRRQPACSRFISEFGVAMPSSPGVRLKPQSPPSGPDRLSRTRGRVRVRELFRDRPAPGRPAMHGPSRSTRPG